MQGVAAMPEQLYTVDQVAEILHRHPSFVRNEIKRRMLAASKIGREYRISDSDLRDYLRRTRLEPK